MIVIGICVFNSSKYIKKAFTNLDILIKELDKPYIIFSYDKSHDNTFNEILQYSKSRPNIIIINKTREYHYSKRTSNISNARNRIMNYMKQCINNISYFIMMDFNYIHNSKIHPEILHNYFKRNDWDALSFNKEPYYDIWALSIDPYYMSCWNFKTKGRTYAVDKMQSYIINKLNNTGKDKLLSCISAFNGFAIYRYSKFKDISYSGKFNLNNWKKFDLNENIKLCGPVHISEEDCEHRNFHINALNKNENLKICISPLCLFY